MSYATFYFNETHEAHLISKTDNSCPTAKMLSFKLNDTFSLFKALCLPFVHFSCVNCRAVMETG